MINTMPPPPYASAWTLAYGANQISTARVPLAPVPLPLHGLGADDEPFYKTETFKTAYVAASWIGAIGGAYHGYRRNDSIGWAIGWSIFGSVLPFLALPIALAQGFGQPMWVHQRVG